MNRRELVDKLAQLQEELSRTERVDPKALALLRKLSAEIQPFLDEDQNLSADEAEPVTSGLKNLLLKFEAEHPQLSVAVGKVADALAAVGF